VRPLHPSVRKADGRISEARVMGSQLRKLDPTLRIAALRGPYSISTSAMPCGLVDQTVNRALDMLDIEFDYDLFPRWQGPAKPRREPVEQRPQRIARAAEPAASAFEVSALL
jgi:hypothetical protein